MFTEVVFAYAAYEGIRRYSCSTARADLQRDRGRGYRVSWLATIAHTERADARRDRSGGPRMRDTEKDERRYRQSANTSFKSHDDS